MIVGIVTEEARLGGQEAVGHCSPEVMVVRPPNHIIHSVAIIKRQSSTAGQSRTIIGN